MMRLLLQPGDRERLENRISDEMQRTILDKGLEYTDAWTEGATWVLGLIGEMSDGDNTVSKLPPQLRMATPRGVVH